MDRTGGGIFICTGPCRGNMPLKWRTSRGRKALPYSIHAPGRGACPVILTGMGIMLIIIMGNCAESRESRGIYCVLSKMRKRIESR